MKTIAAATVVLGVAALCADAPSTIRGRVVADATGDPVPNARVSLITTVPGTPVVLADGDGRFVLPVPAGRVTVVASKSGYARRVLTPIVSSGGPLEIRLSKGAAIVGRVIDEFGDPIASARVSVEAVGEAAGQGDATVRGGPPGPPQPPGLIAPSTGTRTIATAETDDLGEYRIASLPAGSFVVAASTVNSPATVQFFNGAQTVFGPRVQKLYYPGVESVNDGQPLHLQPGDDRRGIDFNLVTVQSDNEAERPVRVAAPPEAFARVQDGAIVPTATGVVRGRVLGTNGRALPHAQVRLFATNGRMMPRAGRADDGGDFEFQELPTGKYRATASKVGYSIDRSVEPVMIDLGDGQIRERVEVRLARWGAIEGHVLDETGDPLQGASVQVLQLRYVAGRRRLVPSSFSRTTDDLGHYRLFGFPPGQYIVSAAVGAVSTADLPGYSRSYFPSTPNPGEAQFVPLALSQEVTGIDVMMARVRTARVLGKIVGPDGEPSMAGSLTLFPSERSMSVTSVPVGARILPDGRFEFPNVAPGQYVIQAYRGRKSSSTEGEFGALPVTVDGADVTNLVLQTTAGSSIAGRFTFDASLGTKIPRRGAIELSPIPVDFDASPQNNFARAEIHDDWTFEMTGVSGPRRLQLMRAPAGWALKEIRVNGIEATDRAFAFGRPNQSLRDVEVVLTDRISELAGTITDERGAAAPGTRLIVFTSDRDRWYPGSRFLRQTTAGANGAFSIAGLAYGSYYAAAVARPPAGGDDGWQDPEFLESLIPRASSVAVRDGEKQTLGVRLSAR